MLLILLFVFSNSKFGEFVVVLDNSNVDKIILYEEVMVDEGMTN